MIEQDSNKTSQTFAFKGEVFMSKHQPIDIKPSYSELYTMNGFNNRNFKTYSDLYDDSTTNNAVIDSFTNYIYGEGLNLLGGNISKYLDGEDARMAVKDLKIQGGFCMLVYWMNEKPLRLNYIDIEKVAIVLERGTYKHKSYYFSLDWDDISRYPKKQYPKFTGKYNGNKIELIYVKNLSKKIFPQPDYLPCVNWCKFEAELSNSGISFIENSIDSLTVINVNNGRIDDEVEAKKKADDLRETVTGSRNKGKVVVNFQEGAELSTTIDKITPPDLNQQNVFFSEEAERNIIKGHKAHPILFSSSQTSTGFSNNAEERTQALQDMYRRNINPFREVFINGLMPFFKLINPSAQLQFIDFDKVDELEEETKPLDNTTLNAQAQLKGSVGGVQSLLEVQASYVSGTTSYESAIAILDLIFGFNREQAIRLLGNPKPTAETL